MKKNNCERKIGKRKNKKKTNEKKHFEILKIQERSKINQKETPELNVQALLPKGIIDFTNIQ